MSYGMFRNVNYKLFVYKSYIYKELTLDNLQALICHKNNQATILLWTPTYGRAKAGRPARTYIQQLCEDTGCSPEDLPEALNDRAKWRERVRDIRART